MVWWSLSAPATFPVLHVHGDGATPKGFHGSAYGMFCNTRFTVHRLTLAHGDTLFLYTDGLTEARNRAGAEYGLHRIRTLAARHAGDRACGADLGMFLRTC